MFLSKKPKIEFYTSIECASKTFPIVESRNIKYDWVSKAAKKFADSDASTVRCPGIFGLKNDGWMLRTWQDIDLHVENGNWQARSPYNQEDISGRLTFDTISEHPEFLFSDFFDNWPEGSLRKVLKINTGWFAKIPKGYVLKQYHPAYLDENRFTTLPGLYSSEYGIAVLNIPVIWHASGETRIKAGTPIAQFSLCKKESYDFSVECIHDNEDVLREFHLQQTIYGSTYKKNYSAIKKFLSTVIK